MARKLDELAQDFSLFDDWEDRYSYVTDLGRKLPPMPVEDKIEANRVRACSSQVWFKHRTEAGCASVSRATVRGWLRC